MRNLLALVGLAVVLVGGLGWYRGWYQVATQPGADGHQIIKVDVDKTKFTADEKAVEKKAKEIIGNQANSTSPVPTPEKKVEGQTTGFQFNPDGSASFVLPKIEVKTGN